MTVSFPRPILTIGPGSFWPHKTVEQFGLRFHQINDHQPIDGVTKFSINIKGDKLPIQLKIMPDKHRYKFAIIFNFVDSLSTQPFFSICRAVEGMVG